MTKTLPLSLTLGSANTGKLIGYTVLNLDRTEYAAFVLATESDVPGTYYADGGYAAPDAGGYLVVSSSDGGTPAVLTAIVETDIEPAIGLVTANVTQILGTTLTETVAGYLAAAFKKFFNVSTPTGTVNSLPDVVAGAPSGLAIVGSEMGLAKDAITASKYDELTAFPLSSADTGSTKVARVGADSDTLETLSDQLDAIQVITDGIDVSAVTVTTSNNAGELTIKRSATFATTVSGLSIPADWLAVIWTLKGAASDDDDDAVIQVRVSNPSAPLTDGLQRLEGAAPSGSLTIAAGSATVNQAGGTVALALQAAATAVMEARGDAVWDLRVLCPPAGEAEELTTGTADIMYTVTHART